MYCPYCGTEITADSKFCRSCGSDLQMISRALSGQWQAQESDRAFRELLARVESSRRKMVRAGFAVLWAGIVLAAFIGIVGGEDLTALGGLVVLVGIGLMLYSVLLPSSRVKLDVLSPRPSHKRIDANPVAVPQALPEQPRRIASVTERTTELFDESDIESKPHGDSARRGGERV